MSVKCLDPAALLDRQMLRRRLSRAQRQLSIGFRENSSCSRIGLMQ